MRSNEPMIAKRIFDKESGDVFDFKEPYALSTLDGRVPVAFAGQSGQGDIYETPKGAMFLVRYGTDKAERIG